MTSQSIVIIGVIVVGVILDGYDYLTYDPPGAIGFTRQRGMLGMLGASLWIGGLIAFGIVAVIKILG